jgi:hypothetical protein
MVHAKNASNGERQRFAKRAQVNHHGSWRRKSFSCYFKTIESDELRGRFNVGCADKKDVLEGMVRELLLAEVAIKSRVCGTCVQ